MHYFPFFFDLRDKTVLIVGGGHVAARKAELLGKSGCRLRIVAPEIEPILAQQVTDNDGCLRYGSYQAQDLTDCVVAVSATGNDAANRQIADDCRRFGIPLNVVDCPALSDFIFPAIIDRSPVVTAVSSGGAAPVLARRLRSKIEAMLPAALGKLADFCDRRRGLVKNTLPFPQRRLFWEKILDGAVAESVLGGDEDSSALLFQQLLRRFANDGNDTGEVYLIGAGPGDPDLLTFRALRLLQQADVVIYDRLVSDGVLALARRDAEKIFAGKRRGYHALGQADINDLLIRLAHRGLRVARLKGGDPFIFGRGGEERLALQAAGIPVFTAAGITAASGCAAAAGIPLTHRQRADSVRFCAVYGKNANDKAFWQRLAADESCTLVFYMAGDMLADIADRLVAAGRAAATPAALIIAGSTAAQQVFIETLATIANYAGSRQNQPALLIVGDVVSLHAGDDRQMMTAAAAAADTPFYIETPLSSC